jgi:hypothetical protein
MITYNGMRSALERIYMECAGFPTDSHHGVIRDVAAIALDKPTCRPENRVVAPPAPAGLFFVAILGPDEAGRDRFDTQAQADTYAAQKRAAGFRVTQWKGTP